MAESVAGVALGETLTPVGQLRFTQTGPRQFSTFSYDPGWSENPRSFALQPDMPVDGGAFHASGSSGNMRDALAGVFSGAAPDSWGRRLLERTYGMGLSEFAYPESPLNGSALRGHDLKPDARVAPANGETAFGSGGSPRFAVAAEPSAELEALIVRFPQIPDEDFRAPRQTKIALVRRDSYLACAGADTSQIEDYLHRLVRAIG